MIKKVDGIEERDGQWKGETYVFRLRLPRARKDYDCVFCNEPIPKGLRYAMFVTTNIEGPGWETWRLHGECYLSNGSMFDNDGRPKERWNPDNE